MLNYNFRNNSDPLFFSHFVFKQFTIQTEFSNKIKTIRNVSLNNLVIKLETGESGGWEGGEGRGGEGGQDGLRSSGTLRRRHTAGVNISAKPFSRQRDDLAREDKGMSKEE